MGRSSFFALLAVTFWAAPALSQAPPSFLGMWGTPGTGPGQFQSPMGIAVDPSGVVWVADVGRVQAFTPEGTFLTQWSVDTYHPRGLAADGLGRVSLMASFFNPFGPTTTAITGYSASGVVLSRDIVEGGGCHCTIHAGGPAVSPDGTVFRTRWGTYLQTETVAGVCVGSQCWGTPGTGAGQFYRPSSIAVDASGNVYVTDNYLNRVQKHTTDGTFLTQWGSSGSGEGQFSYAHGIAVGPNGEVYVVDFLQSRISQFTGEGAFVTRWGSNGTAPGQFSYASIAVGPSGDIYIADTGNSRVQRFGHLPVPTVRSSWGRLKSIYR